MYLKDIGIDNITVVDELFVKYLKGEGQFEK